MSRVVTSLAALTAAVAGVVVLVPPALAQTSALSAPVSTGPVAVALAGHLDTTGLGEHATVSRLTVTNTGHNALAWSLRPGEASPVTVDYWPAGAASCSTAPASTSAPATLAAGDAVDVCVRVSSTGSRSDRTVPVVPVVTVVAHPA